MSPPWMKFYPSDWRADPALRMCSVSARGLWMEMLCIMHEAEPYGSLRVNGNALTERHVASLAGASVEEVSAWLLELETAGVFSRDDDGVIVSRRMQRDMSKAEADKANGKRGGNPELRKGVNPPVKGGDKAQKPEARSQNSYTADARGRSIDQRMGELYTALGVTDETKSPGLLTISEPMRWVSAGCDIDTDILPALRSIAARGRTVKSWSYCSDAVFEARDRRLAPAPEVQHRPGTSPPQSPKPRNAGEAARLELKRRGEYPDASNFITRHDDEGDGNAGFAGTDIARRLAIAAGG